MCMLDGEAFIIGFFVKCVTLRRHSPADLPRQEDILASDRVDDWVKFLVFASPYYYPIMGIFDQQEYDRARQGQCRDCDVPQKPATLLYI